MYPKTCQNDRAPQRMRGMPENQFLLKTDQNINKLLILRLILVIWSKNEQNVSILFFILNISSLHNGILLRMTIFLLTFLILHLPFELTYLKVISSHFSSFSINKVLFGHKMSKMYPKLIKMILFSHFWDRGLGSKSYFSLILSHITPQSL